MVASCTVKPLPSVLHDAGGVSFPTAAAVPVGRASSFELPDAEQPTDGKRPGNLDLLRIIVEFEDMEALSAAVAALKNQIGPPEAIRNTLDPRLQVHKLPGSLRKSQFTTQRVKIKFRELEATIVLPRFSRPPRRF